MGNTHLGRVGGGLGVIDKDEQFERLGVGLVDQPTAVVHPLVEILSGPRQFLPEVGGGDIEDFPRQRVVNLKEIADDVNEPLLAGQTYEQPRHTGNFGLFN